MSSAGQESQVAQEGNAGGEESTEMLKLRLRRVEAQVEALLNLGIPEKAPPGYAASVVVLY
jgi:vancomycin permeability regulator SanA